MAGFKFLPVFESDFLRDVVVSFKKRSKPIKHKTSAFHLQKVIEKEGDTVCEKLEVEFSLLGNSKIRLFLWEDRWAWIDLRALEKKRWVFECQFEGRIGLTPSNVIVESLEECFTLLHTRNLKKMEEIWKRILLQGPES